MSDSSLPRQTSSVQLRLCPSGQGTFDVDREFARVPCIGEYVDHEHVTYRVVDVHWFEDVVLVVAHTLDRPRAKGSTRAHANGSLRLPWHTWFCRLWGWGPLPCIHDDCDGGWSSSRTHPGGREPREQGPLRQLPVDLGRTMQYNVRHGERFAVFVSTPLERAGRTRSDSRRGGAHHCGHRPAGDPRVHRRTAAMSDHVDRALAHLREHGYPNAKREAVAGIAERYPWIARKANGWQQLARLYVERPEWR
jgi:hypothetical protein